MDANLTRKGIIESGLPILDSLYSALNKADPGRHDRFCLVGPTREEVDAFAPQLSQELVSPESPEYPPLLLTLETETDLQAVLDDQWRWVNDNDTRTWFNMLIMPPGIDVTTALPRDQRKFPWDILKSAGPALLSSALLANAGSDLPCVAIVSDHELLPEQSRVFRRHLGERYLSILEQQARMESRLLRAIPQTDCVRQDRPATKTPEGFDWTSEAYRVCVPRFVWALPPTAELDQPDALGLSVVGLCPLLLEAVHFRRLTRQAVNELVQDVEKAKALWQVAMGDGQRIEDDCFVPLAEVLSSGRWSAAFSDRSLRNFRRFAASAGYPLKRVAEICHSIIEGHRPDEPEPQNTVLILAGGVDAGRALHVTAAFRSQRPRVDESVIRLTCDDAEFLCLMINDPWTQITLRCSSYGTWKAPRITRSCIAEAMIPWPDVIQRKKLLKEVAMHRELAGELREITEDLGRAAANVWEYLGEDGATPWGVEGCYKDVVEYYRDLGKFLRQRVQLKLDALNETQQQPRMVPAPIAILQRQIANAADARERRDRFFDLVEVTLKLDVAIMCSVIATLDTRRVREVFRPKGRRQVSGWQGTLGHWLEAQRSARGVLKELPQSKAKKREVDGFVETLLQVKPEKAFRIADDLIRMRNELKGHGATQPLQACEEACEQLGPKTRDLLDGLEHLRRHAMIYVERVSRKRHETTLVVRELYGDNPEFARNIYPRPPGTPIDSAREGEVYLEYLSPNMLLSLHPWVHFGAAPGRSEEAVWLFDGVKNGKVIYKSAQVPAPASWERKEPELVADVGRLLGLPKRTKRERKS